MDDLERRIIELEAQQHFDRQLVQIHLASLHQRLQALENRPSRHLLQESALAISPGSISKLALAFLLPFLVLLLTGDLAKAIRAIRLVIVP